MKSEALKGHLDGLILAVVAANPAHGYAIIEDLKARSGGAFSLPEGTVYPALHRLERAGLLASSWSDASGRRRRVYRLTRNGRRELGLRRGEWRAFATAVEAVLQ
jgi:PadR family transcriptional regulator PadR